MKAPADLLALCPKENERDLYRMMAFKVELTARAGIEAGFRIYKEALDLPDRCRLVRKRVEPLRELAQRNGSAFREIYPSGEKFTIPPPRVLGPNDARVLEGRARSFYVACLPNARVNPQSSLIHVDGVPLVDYEANELKRSNDYHELNPDVFASEGDTLWIIEDGRPELEIDEAFGSLLGPNSNIFAHWFWEYIPKYLTARLSGCLPNVPVLIPDTTPEPLRDALSFLLPREIDVIELPNAPFRIRRLWCAPAMIHDPFSRNTNGVFANPELRCTVPARFKRLLVELGRSVDVACPVDTGIDRVYLARKSYLPRKLINRGSIEELARSRGFAILYPEEHSILDQFRYLRSARFIVGPHGSQNILSGFSRPGAKLCVLNHPFTQEFLTFSYIVQAAGVDVTLFTGPAVKLNNEPGYPHFGLPHYADYEIDVPKFESFLDTWLETTSPPPHGALYVGKTLTCDDLTLLGESLTAYASLLRRERMRSRMKIASPGFYRNAYEPTVYKLNANGTYCAVQSEEQMEAFGGASLIVVTDVRSTSFLHGYQPVPGGACSWPEGGQGICRD